MKGASNDVEFFAPLLLQGPELCAGTEGSIIIRGFEVNDEGTTIEKVRTADVSSYMSLVRWKFTIIPPFYFYQR